RLDDKRSPRGICRGCAQSSDHLEDGEKCFLRYLYRANLLHPLLSLLLLLQKLALAGDVSAIALREDVLAQRLHACARNDLGSDRGLIRHLEQLPWNEILQLVRDLAAPLVRLVLVDDYA